MPDFRLPPRLELPTTPGLPAVLPAAPAPEAVRGAVWWQRPFQRTEKHPFVILGLGVALLVSLSAPVVYIQSRVPGLWSALSASALWPVPPPTPPPGAPTNVYPKAAGTRAFVCALLPWARYAQALQLTPYPQTPGPHPYSDQPQYLDSHPLPHPWYVSVILAQWLVEQGAVTPTWVGYNFGNSSGTPGFPAVGGGSAYGAPATFAYGSSALDGVEIYEINTRYHFYPAVAQAYLAGPVAQALALGQSPWDFAHYDCCGMDGSSLVQRIRSDRLTRYDNPQAGC